MTPAVSPTCATAHGLVSCALCCGRCRSGDGIVRRRAAGVERRLPIQRRAYAKIRFVRLSALRRSRNQHGPWAGRLRNANAAAALVITPRRPNERLRWIGRLEVMTVMLSRAAAA